MRKMKTGLLTAVIISMVVFTNIAIAQSEKVLQQVRASEERRNSLTTDERKIDSQIFDCLLEYEDSVKGISKPVNQSPIQIASPKYDSKKRIYIDIVVVPGADQTDIQNLIKQEDGTIPYSVNYGE
jgi:hypothetical protein